MGTTEFLQLAESLKQVEYELSKVDIFNHDTLDEADPRKERIRSDVTVEIGGPGTHIKFTVQTRHEHTIIKAAVMDVLNARKARLESQLDELCKQRIASA